MMEKVKKVLFNPFAVAVLFLIAATLPSLSYFGYDVVPETEAVAPTTLVGGVPVVMSNTRTNSTTQAFTWTTTSGFYPDYIEFLSGTDALGTTGALYKWYVGMPSDSYVKIAGSTGVITYGTVSGFTPSSGAVAVGSAVCVGTAGTSRMWAARYSN